MLIHRYAVVTTNAIVLARVMPHRRARSSTRTAWHISREGNAERPTTANNKNKKKKLRLLSAFTPTHHKESVAGKRIDGFCTAPESALTTELICGESIGFPCMVPRQSRMSAGSHNNARTCRPGPCFRLKVSLKTENQSRRSHSYEAYVTNVIQD